MVKRQGLCINLNLKYLCFLEFFWSTLVGCFLTFHLMSRYDYYFKHCKTFAKSPTCTNCLIILHPCWDFVLLVTVTLPSILACPSIRISAILTLDLHFVLTMDFRPFSSTSGRPLSTWLLILLTIGWRPFLIWASVLLDLGLRPILILIVLGGMAWCKHWAKLVIWQPLLNSIISFLDT